MPGTQGSIRIIAWVPSGVVAGEIPLVCAQRGTCDTAGLGGTVAGGLENESTVEHPGNAVVKNAESQP
jgi:hypothetical protein